MKKEILYRDQIIGRHIRRVYYQNLPIQDEYQARRIIVELDSGIHFELNQSSEEGSDLMPGQKAVIYSCDLPSDVIEVPDDVLAKKNLQSPISAIVFSKWFCNDFNVLLEDGAILSVGYSSWAEGVLLASPNQGLSESLVFLSLPSH